MLLSTSDRSRVRSSPARVGKPSEPSGRIVALWRAKAGGDRRVVVNTIDELERSVLFQLMITAPPEQQGVATEIAQAVAQAKVGLPDPTPIPRPPRKKRPRSPGA